MAVTLSGAAVNINGTSVTTYPNDAGTIVSVTMFTSGGNYTVPSNSKMVLVQVVGGGGGSAGYCESGGAGGYAEGAYVVSPGQVIYDTIGGGVGYYGGGGQGGTSSFGGYISATGGYGANQNIAHGGGHGGVGSGGQVNTHGGVGTGHANGGSHSQGGQGGASFFGGCGGVQRHNNSHTNYAGHCPGSGAVGGNAQGDGTTGAAGAGGMVIVTAFT